MFNFLSWGFKLKLLLAGAIAVAGLYIGAHVVRLSKLVQQKAHERKIQKENLKHIDEPCAYSFTKRCE